MPLKKEKTGTITGTNLEHSAKGKKGGLTGSKRVTGEPIEATTVPETQPDVPIPSSPEVAEIDAKVRAGLKEKLQKGVKVMGQVAGAVNQTSGTLEQLGRYASQIGGTVKGTANDHNPSAITNGTLDNAGILAKADADIDESVPGLTSAEAIARNTRIAQQRNYVGVTINKTKLQQDIAKLDIEQQRLIGLLIDGKTEGINNETKAVGYHRAVVNRDTSISHLEQDRELLTQQRIRTEGTQQQTEHIQEQEQLKVQKLKEETEKQRYEIQNIQHDKERLRQEVTAKFLAGF